MIYIVISDGDLMVYRSVGCMKSLLYRIIGPKSRPGYPPVRTLSSLP